VLTELKVETAAAEAAPEALLNHLILTFPELVGAKATAVYPEVSKTEWEEILQ
jgi:hypothetical protein